MTADDLARHVVSLLSQADPPLTIQDGLADRIRLTISVRPMSATELRGFWLPFSGTYGIGAVRLGLERMVDVPGEPRPVPGLVWQTERTVGSAWHVTERQIVQLVEEMVAELLEARRRASGNESGIGDVHALHPDVHDRDALRRHDLPTRDHEIEHGTPSLVRAFRSPRPVEAWPSSGPGRARG
jgi:hypothetical protein